MTAGIPRQSSSFKKSALQVTILKTKSTSEQNAMQQGGGGSTINNEGTTTNNKSKPRWLHRLHPLCPSALLLYLIVTMYVLQYQYALNNWYLHNISQLLGKF